MPNTIASYSVIGEWPALGTDAATEDADLLLIQVEAPLGTRVGLVKPGAILPGELDRGSPNAATPGD